LQAVGCNLAIQRRVLSTLESNRIVVWLAQAQDICKRNQYKVSVLLDHMYRDQLLQSLLSSVSALHESDIKALWRLPMQAWIETITTANINYAATQ
jgi:hypothetical protein